jgi:hypothetical protein
MDEDKIISIKDYVVTETVIEPKTPLADVAAFLKGRKTTGKVQLDLSQGGNQRFLVTERTKLTDAQAAQLRAILGWTSENA